MRASRLLSMLLLLQTRDRVTARQLAQELETSVRTVYRDIASLQAAGVPVYGQGGLDGGYRLVDGYRSRLTGLTDCEAETLFMLPPQGPATDLGFGAEAMAARLKMAAALPPGMGERAARIGQRFLLDATSWEPAAPGTELLPALTQAVKESTTVQAVCADGAERTLMPYGIVLESGHWHAVAGDGHDIRAYALAELAAVHPSTALFVEPPAGFELRLWWSARDLTGGQDLRVHGT
ncbi:HTH domain-containing protein [Streptomyces sp. NPDC046909]|uniref:helix-turn-helix transcriptional regulator n=1 Tax=Streptomyces sp. NPDC046909 TaxID=3155617 RepID=UPI0033D8305F